MLNSRVVVIVGGMGSIFGAVAGALLYAFVLDFSGSYLPLAGADCCTQYSPIFSFILIALVLAFRPQGLFGREGGRHHSPGPPSRSSSAASLWLRSCSSRSGPSSG